MPEENKVQIGIFKVERETNVDEIVAHLELKGYKLQRLMNDVLAEFNAKLYYIAAPGFPKWKGFLSPITVSGEDVLRDGKSGNEGFVLLLSSAGGEDIYAIAGGLGYFGIQEHIDPNFGIDVVSRLIKKEDKVLRASKEKNFVGGVSGSTKFFRKNFNLFENDSFGKIYHELSAVLDQTAVRERFGIEIADVKKGAICIAKSSFKINRAISIQELITIVRGCGELLEEAETISINNVERIAKKKNAALISELEGLLISQLWDAFSSSEGAFLFDLCHRDFEEYLTAAKYVVRKGVSANNFFGDYEFQELDDISLLLSKIREMPSKPSTRDDFAKLIRALKIYSYDADGNDRTKGGVLSHVFGDLFHAGARYFYIDNCWYKINPEFIAELNKSCEHFIKSSYLDGLERKWIGTESEQEYNQKYIGDPNTIVLDRITPQNIELCDILKWDDKNLYLYHIKAGFGNTVRDLAAQITVAATKLSQDLYSDMNYVDEVYEALKSKIGGEPLFDKAGRQAEVYGKDLFKSLFATRKVVFVFAVADISETERPIKEIARFNSNIAKFSLQELVKDMRNINIGMDLRVAQIWRA